MHDVVLSLPLADHPLLTVDTLEIRHASLIPLLFGGDLSVSRLEFHKPVMRIVHAADGRWNVEQLSALRNAGKGSPADPTALPLPTVDLIDGSVEVVDGSRKSTIEDLNFRGEPDSALTWKFALSIADRVQLAGRMVPGGAWEHEATLNLKDIAAWVRPWFALPNNLSAQATLRGRFTSGGIRGRLDAQSLIAGGWTATGGLDIAEEDDVLDIHPDNLRVTTPLEALRNLTLLSGDVRYQKNVVRAPSLQISVYGGPAAMSGYYDLGASEGQLSASWDKLALPGGIQHGGNLTFSLHRPFPMEMVAEGTLFSYATTPQGPWRATLNFGGQGNAGSDFSWHVNATELVWNRRTPIRLDGLELLGAIHRPAGAAPTITLMSAYLPSSQGASGTGFYSFADRSWAIKLAGDRFPLQVIQNAAIGFGLDARGNASLISLDQLALTQAQTTLSMKGSYHFGVPKPLQATVSFTSPPSDQTNPNEQPVLQGAMHGAIVIGGTLLPLQLDIGGHLFGRTVRVAGRALGDIALRVSGEVNPEHAQIETERLRALGGEWSLRATYAFADELLDADLKVGGLPLEDIGAAANAKQISGTAAGEWDAYVLSFPIEAKKIRLRGQGWIHDLGCKGLGADDVHFSTTMEDGVLNVDPITFTRGSAGKGTGTLQWNIARPRHLEGSVAFLDWPLESSAGSALVKLDAPAFTIDLPAEASATTPGAPLEIDAESIAAQIALRTAKEQIGDLALSAEIGGQVAILDDLHGSLLGAPVRGSGLFNVAQPLESRGQFSFDHLDSARIVKLFPQAQGLSGMLRGAASLGPSAAVHPLEPLAVHLQTEFDQGKFRGLPIGILNVNAFMNTDRFVLDDRPGHANTLELAGGNVRLWGRIGRPAPDVLSAQAELELNGLNLDQITRAVNSSSQPTPGRISGNVMLLYNSQAGAAPAPAASPPTTRTVNPAMRKFIYTLYGEAKLELTQSNIATVPIFADLYTLMSLGQGGRGPIGNGSLEARMENGTLFLNDIRYNNRGIDARVQLESPQMWDFPYNPVKGTAVGSAQPLAALKLPLVSDLTGALDALQGNFTSLLIDGTWKKMTRVPVTFAAIGKAMRQLLVGDINNRNQTQGE